MNKPERNYSTIEREALAAVAAIKEFYPYLYGFPFTLITDHNPLTALKGLKDVGGRLARWMLFLQQFQFKIEYKPGKTHGDADALSRQPQGDGGVGGDAVDIGSGGGEVVRGDGDRGMETMGGHDAIGDGGDGVDGNGGGGEGVGGDGDDGVDRQGDGVQNEDKTGDDGGVGGNGNDVGGEGVGGDGDGGRETIDLSVKHKKHGTVSVTSIALQPTFINPEDIRSAQQADKQLKPVIEGTHNQTYPPSTHPGLKKCFVLDGILCRKYIENGVKAYTQIVVPLSLKDMVLKQLHDLSGHLGVKKTVGKVKERFYWPGYEHDIETYVRECVHCQKRNPPNPQPIAPLGTLTATEPFEKISWDIMGPLPVSDQGNKYILVVTDIFTKWVEAFALRDTTSITLATTLVDQVISRYGVPAYIHSDQGANLCSQVTTMCRLLGMGKTRTSAYHPQGNGQVERFNRTVEAMLSKVVNQNQKNWDTCLSKVLFAYRSAIHEATGYTPFHLMFGRTPRLPVDVMLGRVDENDFVGYPQYVQQLHHNLKNAFLLAREKITASVKHQKTVYDKGSRGSELRVGDRVWLHVPAVKLGRTKKLSSLWRGPYTVLDKTSPVNYKIQLIGSIVSIIVHRNRLKPCYGEPDEGIPAVHNPSKPMSYRDALVQSQPSDELTSVGGYTSSDSIGTHLNSPLESTRPVRNRRPPDRYGVPISE